MKSVEVESEKTDILFIDDDSYIREKVSRILSGGGYTVTTASDGRSGLQIFEQKLTNIVITDIRMNPPPDGLEVLGTIKKNHPETPVIILSGEGGIKDVKSALTLGAYDYLTKEEIGADPERLVAAVGRAQEKLQLTRENEAYKNDLENKVAERTAELQKVKELMLRERKISEKLKSDVFSNMHLIQYSEKKYKTLISKAPSGIATINADGGRITAVNKAFVEILGFESEKQLKNQSISDNKIFRDNGFSGNILDCFERQREYSNILPYQGPDNKKRFIEYTLTPFQIDDYGLDREVLFTVKDVTLEKEENNRLAVEAMYDATTGLFKHGKFIDSLSEEVDAAKRESYRLGVAHIDLDDFGAVNKKYGHHAASEILKLMGQRIKSSIDQNKDLGFRVGGDESAIIFTRYQAGSLEVIVERLFNKLSEVYGVNDGDRDQVIKCTFSVGVSTYSEDRDQTAKKLYKEADDAMYIAKERGKNRYFFYGTGSSLVTDK